MFQQNKAWLESRIARQLLFIIACVFLSLGARALELNQWSEVYPSPTRANLVDVANDGANWVAVGSDGTILFSPDADHWIRAVVNPPTTKNISAVMEHGGRWVAVAGTSVLTSTNGTGWISLDVPTTQGFNAVTYGNDRYVAVGNQGLVASSTNGLDWKLETTTSPFANSLYAVAFGKGLFVAGGLNGVQLSENGSDWSGVISLDNIVQSVFFDGERFLAGRLSGYVFQSNDATNWFAPGGFSSSNIRRFARYGDKWLAMGGYLMESEDLTNWVQRSTGAYSSSSSGGEFGVATTGARVVVVGEAGNILSSRDGTNFIQWRQGRPLPFGVLFTHKGEVMATASSGRILLSSADGDTWTERPIGNDIFTARDAVSDGQRMVIVGSAVQGSVVFNAFATSTNDANWTVRRLTSRGGFTGVAKGNSGFVAVGFSAAAFTSIDGLAWVSNSIPGAPAFSGVATDGSRYVAVGAARTNYYSDNGSPWTATPSGASVGFSAIAWGNGLFVAGGTNGVVGFSTNGVDWEPAVSGINGIFRRIIFHQQTFLATTTSGLLTSPDGKSWSLVTSAPAGAQQIAANEAGSFIASSSTIFRNGEASIRLSLSSTPGNEMKVGIQSSIDAIVRLERSGDLHSWELEAVTTNSFGFKETLFPVPATNQFFRARGGQ